MGIAPDQVELLHSQVEEAAVLRQVAVEEKRVREQQEAERQAAQERARRNAEEQARQNAEQQKEALRQAAQRFRAQKWAEGAEFRQHRAERDALRKQAELRNATSREDFQNQNWPPAQAEVVACNLVREALTVQDRRAKLCESVDECGESYGSGSSEMLFDPNMSLGSAELADFAKAGVTDPAEAVKWASVGARGWLVGYFLEAAVTDPGEAAGWLDAGLSAWDALGYAQAGIKDLDLAADLAARGVGGWDAHKALKSALVKV